MDTGTVVLAAGALTHLAVAPQPGAALTDAAAAVLVARAAVTSAPDVGDSADAEACWASAARAAVRVNSSLRVLRAELSRAGLTGDPGCPPTPPPVRLAGQSLADVAAGTERLAVAVAAAREYLTEHRRRTARVIADSARSRAADGTRPAAADPDVHADIDRLLAGVPEDAEPNELAGVHAAAEAARTESAVWHPELRTAVEQLRSNAERGRRRAIEAAGYLEGLAAIDAANLEGLAAIDAGPADERAHRLLRDLDEVVAGRRDLSESLRDDARLLIAHGEIDAAVRLLAHRLQDHLRADGVDVRVLGRSGDRSLIESTGWARSCRVAVGRGEISYRIGAAAGGAAPGGADADWCDAVAGSIARFGRQLAGGGGPHVIGTDAGEVRPGAFAARGPWDPT